MLKFIILSVTIIIAQASDIDEYLVKTISVATFPKVNGFEIGCYWYTPKVVDIKCACNEDTETSHVKLLSYRYVPDNGTEAFFAISVVNTVSEVIDALTKYNTCICGGNAYRYGVYRPINDKFYAQYIMYSVKDKQIAAILAARSEATRTEIKKAIQLVDDLKTTDYSFLCD